MLPTTLQLSRGGRIVATRRLVGAQFVLGRASGCDVVLDSEGVSRRHAELVRSGGGWQVRDLASRNGVIVNGVRIAREHPVGPDDRVQIDVFELRLIREGARPVPVSRPGAELPVVDGGYGVVRTMNQMPAPRLAAHHLSTLLAFSAALLACEAPADRQRRLCELMTGPAFHGTAAMLLRLRRDDPDPEPLGDPVLALGADPPHVSRSVLQALLTSETAVLATSTPAANDSAEVVKLSVATGLRVAAVASPVRVSPECLHVLYVMLPATHGTAEWLALTAMATSLFRQAEDVWAARQAAQSRLLLEDELRRAHDLQMRLVPSDMSVGRLDIGFGFAPCKGVGGDYVDAVRMADGRVLLVAMDVAGKGLDAALVASGLHTTVHICAAHDFALTQMITTLNRYLIDTWGPLTSVTVAASILDPRTGALESINCGHPNPMLVGPGGAARELRTFETIPLGFIAVDIETRTDQLRTGDMLVYYSDGLTELFDAGDAMLGPEGVTRYLAEIRAAAGPHARASDLVDRLHRRLADYRGLAAPSDDVSFIIARAGVVELLGDATIPVHKNGPRTAYR